MLPQNQIYGKLIICWERNNPKNYREQWHQQLLGMCGKKKMKPVIFATALVSQLSDNNIK